MIDFATLQGLTIPEGVVTQITDESGRVIWALANDEPIVLEVAKQTLTTYAGETKYADESFILLDIYPKKSNSTVKVTYGGLTKTLTFSGTNAQQVYFGTFNGVSDEIATAASGTLTIEGGCKGFACGVYQSGSKTTNKGYCGCITDVVEWGGITSISNYAFYNCTALALTSLPSGITSIGSYAFYGCTALALTSLPSGITSIGETAFGYCNYLFITEFPQGLTSIGASAFILSNHEPDIQMPMENSTIVLPDTIAEIGDRAFAVNAQDGNGSYGYIKEVTILAKTPAVITSNTFGTGRIFHYETNIKIIVPKGCGEAYKTAEGWSTYADKIVEAS